MSWSNIIVLALFLAWVIYITQKGHLGQYMKLLGL